jgi:membrane protease YdiL (CAAX protease family)
MSSLLNLPPTATDRPRDPAGLPGLPTPPSGARVLRLLARVAWLRVRNQMSLGFAFLERKKPADAPAGSRQATPGEGRGYAWLFLLVALCILGQSAFLTVCVLGRLSDRLSPRPQEESVEPGSDLSHPGQDVNGPAAGKEPRQPEVDSGQTSHRGPLWPPPPDDGLMVSVMGLLLLLIGLGCLTSQLGGVNQDLGKVEWDMEWLFTFPVPARTLFLARLVQYATAGMFSMMLWLGMAPSLAVIYACAGYGWWAIPLALAATGSSVLVIASLCLVVETWVQKRLSPGHRKNLQAVFGLLGGLLLMVAMVAVMRDTFDPLIMSAVRLLPGAVWVNPLSLPALLCLRGWAPLGAGAAMALLGVAVPFGAVRLAGRLVGDGLVAAPGAYQGSRGRARPATGAGWFRGVVGKELRLLMRDRAFLVRTLVLPVLMAGFYFFLYWQAGTSLIQDPRPAAAMAFGLGCYVLLFSAFQGLAAEGDSSWLLYTFPRKLHALLLQKTFLWCGFALLYALAVLVIAALVGMPLGGEALVAGAGAVVGVILYAFIASALGTLATNPLEAVAQRRVRVDLQYFFMLLASLYALTLLYSPSIVDKVGQVVLAALLAFAFWQKVQDRIPYLLDPAQSPPRRLSLVDGLIAVQAFLTVQGLVLIILLVAGTPLPVGTEVLIATGIAGAVVGVASLYFLRRVPGLLVLTGLVADPAGPRPTARQVLVPGVVAGVLAGLVAIAYMAAVGRVEALRPWKEALAAVPSPTADPGWFAWVVLAAPLFEEFLFRGLVYQGLRRSVRPAVAVLGSAALFALVHPSFKLLPVFVLGVATALSFRRSRLLWTSVLTHVVYNAIVAIVGPML